MNPTIKEWLFAREVLRRIGFEPDELYFSFASSGIVQMPDGTTHDLGMPVIGLEVRRGERRFVWTIGGCDMPPDAIQAAYEAACEVWNRGEIPLAEFTSSKAFGQGVRVMMELYKRGMYPQGAN